MPLYTYRCSQGHQWDEVRGINEASEVSSEPCQTCLETADNLGYDIEPIDLPDFAGHKIPAQVSVKLAYRDATPTFYPNRDHK